MARAKKEAALTPEERLQAALVPDWEWPYKLPENWCWVYAPHIFDIEYGKGLPTKQLSDTGYPVFGANGQIGFYSEYMYKEPQALMSCRGAYSGTMNKSLPYSYVTSNSLIISSPRGLMGTDCIYYLFSALNVSELISGTAQPQVTVQAFDGFPIPLSPLAEQQRIVDRIESLFAKLDEAKEKAQTVVDSFETRKAAILHKAFTGELSAKWREEHGVGMESWRTTSFKDVCKKITDGTHHSPINTENGEYMYITAKNIKENGIDLTNITFVSKDVHEEIYSRCDVQYGDVLYIKDGATTGIATVNTIDKPFSLLSSVAVLRPDKKQILAEYMAYNLNSSKTKTMMISSMSGNAITRLTLSKIKAASITICSLDEQEEIVRLIDNLLGKEQQAKETAKIVLNQIDLMKKSILARAFRGELGTNDPSEESAVELLKQII